MRYRATVSVTGTDTTNGDSSPGASAVTSMQRAAARQERSLVVERVGRHRHARQRRAAARIVHQAGDRQRSGLPRVAQRQQLQPGGDGRARRRLRRGRRAAARVARLARFRSFAISEKRITLATTRPRPRHHREAVPPWRARLQAPRTSASPSTLAGSGASRMASPVAMTRGSSAARGEARRAWAESRRSGAALDGRAAIAVSAIDPRFAALAFVAQHAPDDHAEAGRHGHREKSDCNESCIHIARTLRFRLPDAPTPAPTDLRPA